MGKYSSKKFRYNRHNVMRDLAKRKEFKMYEEDVTLQNDLWNDLIKDLKDKFKNLNKNTKMVNKMMSDGLFGEINLFGKNENPGAAPSPPSSRTDRLAGNFLEAMIDIVGSEESSGNDIGTMVLNNFLKGSILKDNRFDPTTMYGNINRGKYLYNEEDVDKKNKGFSKKINQLFSSVKDDISTSVFDDLYGGKINKYINGEDKKDPYEFTDFWSG